VIVDVVGKGVVFVGDDDTTANLSPSVWLRESRPCGEGEGTSTRMVVEVLRRFGGMAPRVVVGGEFVPHPAGDATRFEVGHTAGYEGAGSTAGRLWRTYTVGLPEEFARGVLSGLINEGNRLPAGTLRIDRGAFSDDTAGLVCRQAGEVLRVALSTTMGGGDVEAEVRLLMRG
jgi:hypothetical protein